MSDDALPPAAEAATDLPDPHEDRTTDPRAVVRGGRGRAAEGRNVANAAQVKADEKRLRQEDAKREADLRYLITLPSFRRFAWWLCNQAGTFARPRELNALSQVLQGRAEIGRLVWLAMEQANPVAPPALIAEMTGVTPAQIAAFLGSTTTENEE